MATDQSRQKQKIQGFDCVLKPVPPGTKSRGRLPRPGDPEPSVLRKWALIAVAIIGVLAIGVAIGRFLLP
jgi:hypothetical protein